MTAATRPATATRPVTAGSWTGRAWSCTVRLVVTDERVLRAATADLRAELARVDAVASRFAEPSALSRANAHPGRPIPIPRLLVDLVAAALDAAVLTDGAVDPTVGRSMTGIGYGRDIDAVRRGDADPAELVAGGYWRQVRLDRRIGLLTVPSGCALDLGATAKAWTADHAARTLANRYGSGVLVELGGDLAVAGASTAADIGAGTAAGTGAATGWTIRVAEREGAAGQLVRLTRGGLATSTTTVRTWTQAGQPRHHIVDPATGAPVDGPWRSVTVHAPTALAANTASTAALVKGSAALDWLTGRGLPARLVDQDGAVVTTPGWPSVDHVFLPQGRQVAPATSPTQENVIARPPATSPTQENVIPGGRP